MRATILIVHRDDYLLRAITQLLALDEHDVHCVRTVGGALDAMTRGPHPDVVLVDEETAGEHWFERLEGIADHVPRVLLTWTPRPADGRHLVLCKPFGARELRDLLRAVLSSTRRASWEAPPRPLESG
ncbi:MAG TPA: hypothetical protein VFP65_09515 [Anaeromyxobacteraceae bacterium]|nr:hypothetical protein [Anaeromyxobacteraceae bacterium]